MTRIDTTEDFTVRLGTGSGIEVSDCEIHLSEFDGRSGLRRVTKKHFKNVSFKNLRLSRIHFEKCTFEDCIFIGTEFERCDFHACSFTHCNFFRALFSKTKIDPKDLLFTTPKTPSEKKYPFINVDRALFNELASNSLELSNDDYYRTAKYQVFYWKTRLTKSRPKRLIRMIDEVCLGYRIRYKNLIFTTLITNLLLILAVYFFWTALGICSNSSCPPEGFSLAQAMYYYFTVVCTLGFGDLVPTTVAGKLLSSGLCMFGLFQFGTWVNVICKRAIN